MTISDNFLSLFRQAAPYIHAHRHKTFVIHFDADFNRRSLLQDLHDCALLQSLGIHLILVHGMREQIEDNLKAANIDSEFYQGKRITRPEILPFILDAAGSTRLRIEAALSMGMANSPMQDADVRVASGNFLTAQPVGVIDGHDMGYSGKVRRINSKAILSHLELGEIVLVSPLGYSLTGDTFNLNSEEVASAIAVAVKADKLIYISNAVNEYIAAGNSRQLTPIQAHASQAKNEFLRQRLSAAADACDSGIRRIHLVERNDEGSLIKELFTRDGTGIMVTMDNYDALRKATADDINALMNLIEPLQNKGILVRRSREQLESEVEHYYVLVRDNSIIACAALYHYLEEKTAEIACLAVDTQYRHHHRADHLLTQLEKIAHKEGCNSVFILTTQTAQWFEERGFNAITVEELPQAKREHYNHERKSLPYRKIL